MTLQVEISPEIQAILREERYSHPSRIVQRRMEALWLKSQGLPHRQIAQLVGIGETTLREYLHLYQAQGLAGLRTLRYQPQTSELEQHQAVLAAHFKANPPATIGEAQQVIQDLTGLRRGATQVRAFLKKNLISVGVKSG
jgi:transposase